MNKFKIRILKNFDLNSLKFYATGILKVDAKLWRDEYILETEMEFEEVQSLPFVLAIKRLA